MLFIKGIYLLLSHLPTSPTIGLRIPIVRHHHLIAPTARCENRRRAVSYVSTGLACLPRDTDARASTAEERLYKRHPIGLQTQWHPHKRNHLANNLYNRSSAVDSSFNN